VAPNQGQEFKQTVKDVYFDFDRAELRPDDQATLRQDADWLKAHPDVLFTIAGQADPRGDVVYNLFLSDRRALATRDALVKLGVPENQILFAEGWGKLYPCVSRMTKRAGESTAGRIWNHGLRKQAQQKWVPRAESNRKNFRN